MAELLSDLVRILDQLGQASVPEEYIRPIIERWWEYHMDTMDLPIPSADEDTRDVPWSHPDEDTQADIQKSRASDVPLEKSVPYSRELEGRLRLCKAIDRNEAMRWRKTGLLPSAIDIARPVERHDIDASPERKMAEMLGSTGTSLLAVQHLIRGIPKG